MSESNPYQPILDKYLQSKSLPPPGPQPPLLANSEKTNTSPLPKIMFFVSLLIFLSVISTIVFRIFSKQQNPLFSAPTPTSVNSAPVTVPSVSEEFCLINGQNYSIGQSFPANDNCNFCTCQPDLIISCTQLDCSN